jgi:hypothetical protein
MSAHADDLPEEAQGACENIYKRLTADTPESILTSATSWPTDALRNAALTGIALSPDTNASKPGSRELALGAALLMPDTSYSLHLITRQTAALARTSTDPFSFVAQSNDPYQQNAAIDGVTQGLIQSNGLDGVTKIVQQGVSSNEEQWLEAAASVIVPLKTAAGGDKDVVDMIMARNSGADSKYNNNQDWKRLPPDTAKALLDYANSNWNPERLAALKARLGQ